MNKMVMRTSMTETDQLTYSWIAHVSQDQVKQGGMCCLVQLQQALSVLQRTLRFYLSKSLLALTQRNRREEAHARSQHESAKDNRHNCNMFA